MKYLVDINHPAHVHFFKNIISGLKERGDQVVVTASLKEVNYQLLKELKIDFIDLGSYGNNVIQKALNVPIMALKMARVVQKHKPGILMGIASSRICHGTLFSRKRKTYVFTDTEHAKEQIALFKPFATKIFTPDSFSDNLGPKQVRYPSYHDLAYLHPYYFTPNPKVLDELGLKRNDIFFLLRFVSWQASHDIGQKGLSLDNKRELVNYLQQKGTVFISDEADRLPPDLVPYRLKVNVARMHDLLAFATIYIGEGATMASEAAVLGTSAIFISTLTAGCLQELEHKYQLLYNLQTFKECQFKLEEILNETDFKNIQLKRKEKLLSEKVNASEWVLNNI